MFACIHQVLHHVKRWRYAKSDEMELQDRLKQARENAGKSVNEVAASLGVTRVQIWRMEKNADFVSVGRLRQLAELYGEPLQSFFNDNIATGDADVSYQLIGMTIDAVESVASKMPERPKPDALRSATLSVIRAQQKRWAEDPHRRFNPEEFVALIEQHFEDSNRT